MFYICKKAQTKFHKKPKNKTYEPNKERNWQIKQIHHWQNKQQTKKFNKLKSMERQVRSHQLVQQREEKRNHTFIVFDIQDFYRSISKYILTKAVEFAKTKVSI